MYKKIMLLCVSMHIAVILSQSYLAKPHIDDKELEITPLIGETCYQYAERKVNEMIEKYYPNRIVGSDWLSAYWAHHYEGALVYRNYTWQPV